jgi:hypothetical protein
MHVGPVVVFFCGFREVPPAIVHDRSRSMTLLQIKRLAGAHQQPRRQRSLKLALVAKREARCLHKRRQRLAGQSCRPLLSAICFPRLRGASAMRIHSGCGTGSGAKHCFAEW